MNNDSKDRLFREACHDAGIDRERRGCPKCAKALALINQHLSGRVYDDLDDALRNLLQAFVTTRDLSKELRCDFVGCEECAARKRKMEAV